MSGYLNRISSECQEDLLQASIWPNARRTTADDRVVVPSDLILERLNHTTHTHTHTHTHKHTHTHPAGITSAGVGRHDSDVVPTDTESTSPNVPRQTLLPISKVSGAPTFMMF
jgi:hypothetical protein